jgi:hypothetical protein
MLCSLRPASLDNVAIAARPLRVAAARRKRNGCERTEHQRIPANPNSLPATVRNLGEKIQAHGSGTLM